MVCILHTNNLLSNNLWRIFKVENIGQIRYTYKSKQGKSMKKLCTERKTGGGHPFSHKEG